MILLQQTNIAVHHEVQTVYRILLAFLPLTTQCRHKEPTHVAAT